MLFMSGPYAYRAFVFAIVYVKYLDSVNTDHFIELIQYSIEILDDIVSAS